MKRVSVLKFGLVVVAVASMVLAACGNDDGSDTRDSGSASASGSGSASASASGSGAAGEATCEPVGDEDEATSTVKVVLDEFTITADKKQVPAGQVHFAIHNKGDEPHEFVVIKGVAPADLPLDEDGALNEDDLPKGALIGEVEPFPGGDDCDGTFDLSAGEHTLLCNITEQEDGKTESHVHEGMVTTLTVI
jgi:hypothetical protein